MAQLTREQQTFILELTDHDFQSSTRGSSCGQEKYVKAHVVVMANEPPPPLWHEKELWLLDLRKGDHLRGQTETDACTWHFPGEAPSMRAQVGKVGRVAKPWDLHDPDQELQAAAAMLRDWRADTRRLREAALREALPPAKRAKLDAMSPASRSVVGDLLQAAFDDPQ